MPNLAKKIVLDTKTQKLFIDDVEFPYFVKDNVQEVKLSHGFEGVELTIIAEEVEVI